MPANAQIKITYPLERAVFQRDNGNKATLSIGGYYSQAIDKVEARLVPVIQGQGQAVDWTLIQSNPANGMFFGKITGFGGWYTLEVRGMKGNVQVGRDALSRLGIGEVFLIAGDSNAEGLPNYNAPASNDDRVNTISYNNRATNSLNDPINTSFTRITATGIIGPRGQGAWCWGALGDRLAAKLNVPILFMNVAWAGTSVRNWGDSFNVGPLFSNPVTGENLPIGMPYGNLKTVIKYFGNMLGLRAVLWQQNEGDVHLNTTSAEYQSKLQYLINLARGESRGEGGLNDYLYVPWLIARTSRMTQWYNPSQSVSPQLIEAQNQIISTNFNKIYPGPITDNIQVPRPDGLHFQGEGLNLLARAWDDVMLPQFFAASVPILPKSAVAITVRCNTNNSSLTLSAPAGYASYRWQDGVVGQNYTANGPGTYQVLMKDANGSTIFTPPLVITESLAPITPIISPAGDQLVCADSTLALSVNVPLNNNVIWGTGETTKAIRVGKDGSYTARAVNMFGCSSAASAPVNIKTLSMKAPAIYQSGPYSVAAKPDTIIYLSKGSTVQNIVWDWRQGTTALAYKNQFLKVVQNGDYSARVRVTFESAGSATRVCPSPYTTVFKYQLPTQDDGLIIYPNPNRTGQVAIETLRDLTNVEIVITNASGQIVFEHKMPFLNERTVVSLVNLKEGKYLFRLMSAGFSQTKKLIIDY
jgi:Secretion system C-terminal sorting domain/Carbohydrate esterase, sialic acid-specific acetylesterase